MDLVMETISPEPDLTDTARSLPRIVSARLCGEGIVAWAVNRPWVRDAEGNPYRLRGMRGMADVLGIMPGTGRFVAVATPELDPEGKPYTGQFSFLDSVNALGGAGFFLTDLDCLARTVYHLKSGGDFRITNGTLEMIGIGDNGGEAAKDDDSRATGISAELHASGG